MKNYFRAWPGALGELHINNGSRDINLQSKVQFKSKIYKDNQFGYSRLNGVSLKDYVLPTSQRKTFV